MIRLKPPAPQCAISKTPQLFMLSPTKSLKCDCFLAKVSLKLLVELLLFFIIYVGMPKPLY